jgi:polar amino acid transport system substrate-binding protein
MKKFVCLFSVICLLAATSSCKKEDIKGDDLRIICMILPPYTFLENDQLKGISADAVGQVMDMMGVKNKEIEVGASWAPAYELLRTTDNIALFTCGLTPERKGEVQWAGPIVMLETGFVGIKSSGIEINSMDEARKIENIGVMTGWASAETLVNLGFTNLKYFTTLPEAVKALYSGTVSTLFNIANSVRITAANEGLDANQVIEQYSYCVYQGHIVFSPGVSPKLVASWQDKIDELKKQGTLQQIYNKYLTGIKAPGIISIFTTSNAPESYWTPQGILSGGSVEVVEALNAMSGLGNAITMTSFMDCLGQVDLAPNTMTFTTSRTAEREPLYKWVGPITKKTESIYVLSGSNIQTATLDDAKNLESIGTPELWSVTTKLQQMGFTNLKIYENPDKVYKALINGEISAATFSNLSVNMLAEQNHRAPGDIRKAVDVFSASGYLAFSLDTKSEYIQSWEEAYSTLMGNGKFAEIWAKWYPGIKW